MQKKILSIVSYLGWPMLCFAILFCIAQVEVRNNLFDWKPKFSILDIFALGISFAFVIAIVYLSQRLSNSVMFIIALISSSVLACYGIKFLLNEKVVSGFLGRTTLSPLWYKMTLSMLFFAPLAIWFVALYKHRNKHAASGNS